MSQASAATDATRKAGPAAQPTAQTAGRRPLDARSRALGPATSRPLRSSEVLAQPGNGPGVELLGRVAPRKRSEEHTSELQSLMRISYAVFYLKNTTVKPS